MIRETLKSEKTGENLRSKIKMEEEIASKREKLEELKLSLKNTKVISFRIELLARLGLIESSILSKDLLKC